MSDITKRRGLRAAVRLAGLSGKGKYLLGAGTSNPNSPTPFSFKNGVYASDCSRAVLWALQTAPVNPGFPEYKGHINVDSMMIDAGNGAKFFRFVEPEDVYPGCLIAFRSIRGKELPGYKGKREDRVRIGHVGLVAGWDGLIDPNAALLEAPQDEVKWNGKLSSLVTVECCASTPAIRLRRNVNFLDNRVFFKGMGPPTPTAAWGVRFLEYVGP